MWLTVECKNSMDKIIEFMYSMPCNVYIAFNTTHTHKSNFFSTLLINSQNLVTECYTQLINYYQIVGEKVLYEKKT